MQRRTKFLILASYYLVAVIIGIVVVVFSTPICLQEQCVEKSAFILSKMDRSANPCENFYKFMCGSAREFPPPDFNFTHNSTSESDPLQTESVFKYMVRKVSNYAGATRSGSALDTSNQQLFHETLLSQFFTMCDDVSKTNDQATLDDVVFKMQDSFFGTGMSVRDVLNPKKFNHSLSSGVFEYKLRIAGFPGRHYFTADIQRDPNEKEILVLYIGRPVTFLSIAPDDIEQVGTSDWITVFKSLITTMYDMSAKDNELDMSIIQDILKLWSEMATVISVKEDKVAKDEAIRLTEMQKRFPDLDFIGFLDEMGAKDINKRFIYVKNSARNYFAALEKTLKKYSRQVKVAYQFWQMVWDATPFFSLSLDISSLLNNVGSLSTVTGLCRGMLGNRFGGLILSLVIERFKLQRNPPEILNLVFPNFVDVMMTWLHKSSWMDSKTKEEGTAKLKVMKKQVSLSKKQYDSVRTPGKRARYYSGLCIQRSVLMTLLCINRFFSSKNFGLFNREITGFDDSANIPMGDIKYHQNINTFQVPIFILRFPAFDNFWPVHVNFGGLGVEISTELTGGFDFKGSQRDKFGLAQGWWTNRTLDNYKRKEVQCSSIVRQLEKTIKASNYIKSPTNLTDTDLENGELADRNWKTLLGVKMSLKAYIDHQRNVSYRGKVLPGLEMYTHHQNFFLAHAHMRCLPPMPNPELKARQMLYFQALSNTKEFKEAFACAAKKGKPKQQVISKAADICALF